MPVRSLRLCGESIANAPLSTPMHVRFPHSAIQTSTNPFQTPSRTVSRGYARPRAPFFHSFLCLFAPFRGPVLFRKLSQRYASQKDLHPCSNFSYATASRNPVGCYTRSGPISPNPALFFPFFMKPCATNTSHQITPLNTRLTHLPPEKVGRSTASASPSRWTLYDTLRHASAGRFYEPQLFSLLPFKVLRHATTHIIGPTPSFSQLSTLNSQPPPFTPPLHFKALDLLHCWV